MPIVQAASFGDVVVEDGLVRHPYRDAGQDLEYYEAQAPDFRASTKIPYPVIRPTNKTLNNLRCQILRIDQPFLPHFLLPLLLFPSLNVPIINHQYRLISKSNLLAPNKNPATNRRRPPIPHPDTFLPHPVHIVQGYPIIQHISFHFCKVDGQGCYEISELLAVVVEKGVIGGG